MIQKQQDFGITSIGLAIPQYAMSLETLALLRAVPPQKYTEVLGCKIMSLCAPGENVASLAVKAARRAIENWGQDLSQIGLLVVATETSFDMSRPLSSWVMQELGLSGNIRSYEVKHACYGGTVAVRQALEWKLSGNSKNKAALVIAADVALYSIGHSGEPTQGAGAVALIIDDAKIASINTESYYWSDPQFDFWRPVGKLYPEVNGRLSLSCYINATLKCFTQLLKSNCHPGQDEILTQNLQLGNYLQEFAYVCFHVPFPKMVHKAIRKLGEHCGLDEAATEALYNSKILSTMQWNQIIGNSYTASLWFAVTNALMQCETNQQIAAFSYGSGCGSELLTLRCLDPSLLQTAAQQLQHDFDTRKIIDANIYNDIRNAHELSIEI